MNSRFLTPKSSGLVCVFVLTALGCSAGESSVAPQGEAAGELADAVLAAGATSDPTCVSGIANGATCCAASCGSCGGTGCDTRPGGAAACCSSAITAAKLSCLSHLPPCVIEAAPATTDPTCKTGIANGDACCAASCGSCGGTGCDQRPGGAAACCGGNIRAAGVSCSGALPPCVIGATTPTTPTSLTAKAAAAAMANGFNLGNTFERRQHPTTAASINATIDAYYNQGFRTLRLPVKWINAGFPDGDLASATGTVNRSHARLTALSAAIDYALGKGMYVVVNTHHDDWLFNATWNTNQLTVHGNLWRGICDIYKDRDQRLFFEVMNEPHGSVNANAEAVRAINQGAYDIIRKCGGKNATRVIIIDGQDWGSPASLGLTWPSVTQIPGGGNDPYVMGSIHYYSPMALTHAETAAGINTAWTTAGIQADFQRVSTWANGKLPIFVGEFGVNWDQYAHQINTNTINWYRTVASETRARGWAFTVWDDGGWFRVINRSTQAFNGLQDACVP